MLFPHLPPSFGSTDMGNVSSLLPSIHPFYSVRSDVTAPLNIHTKEFQVVSGTEEAHWQTMKTALALAMTGLELVLNRELAMAAKKAFLRSPARVCRWVLPTLTRVWMRPNQLISTKKVWFFPALEVAIKWSHVLCPLFLDERFISYFNGLSWL